MNKALRPDEKIPPFLLGDSEMVRLTREFDWDDHELGPFDQWPDTLVNSLGILFNNRFPMFIFWGPQLYCFYNDAYRPSLGKTGEGKHPFALGKPGRDVWPEIWHIIGPQIDQVLNGGPATWYEDELVPIFRNGKIEEVYWTYCYSALRDRSGAAGGVLVTCMETTNKVIADRNWKTEGTRAMESESRFRSLAENLPDIVSRHDKLLRYSYVNSQITKYTGKKPEELFSKRLSETGWPAEISELLNEQMIDVLVKGKPRSIEFQNPSGEYFHVRFMPEFDALQNVQSVLTILTDITERKQREQVFQDNKERLQAALDASLTGTFRWDLQTNELSWDANLDRLFGLPPGETVQSLESFIARVYVDDRQGVIDLCQKCASQGSDFNMEFRVIWPDGSMHWLDDKGKTYKNADGLPVYMTGACVDVTEAVETRRQIQESELRFRSIFENAAVGVAVVDLNGRWLLVNDKLSEIVGYDKRELLGLTFQDITYKEDLSIDLANANNLLAGHISTYSMEKRYVSRNGNLIWVNLTVSLMLDEADNPLYFISIVEDISERKKAEEALSESRNQLTQLSNLMPQMVWSTQADGYHDFFNQRWYDFTGLTPEQSKAIGWATVLHPDDVQRTWVTWNESLRSGKVYEAKYRMRRADGEYRWLLARAVPFRNVHGEIVRWFGSCTDIHDQKTAEEKLEVLVSERTIELQRSNEDLQQFAHVASHDLKEPLRKVRLFADKLVMSLNGGDSSQQVAYLHKIDRAVERMASMIDGILEYSSLEGFSAMMESVDLNAVIKVIQSDLEFVLKQKNGEIVSEQLPTVFGSSVLLQRVFNNLIVNALKFSHPDRSPVIKISAERISSGAESKLKIAGDYFRILIQDNGIGFSPDEEEIIFSTFIRLHPKDKYEGTGLGLALCRKIIERHHGLIYAKGESNMGATFVIMLPAMPSSK